MVESKSRKGVSYISGFPKTLSPFFLRSSFAVSSLFLRTKLTPNLPQTYLKLTPYWEQLRIWLVARVSLEGNCLCVFVCYPLNICAQAHPYVLTPVCAHIYNNVLCAEVATIVFLIVKILLKSKLFPRNILLFGKQLVLLHSLLRNTLSLSE